MCMVLVSERVCVRPIILEVSLHSLSECCNSSQECVAPTALEIVILSIPSPHGLGYGLPRFRRCIEKSQIRNYKLQNPNRPRQFRSAGGAAECSPTREGWERRG